MSEARELMVTDPQRTIQVEVLGEGVPVVLIPSLGRGAQDFDDLKERLTDAGYQVILPLPRGIGQSTGSTTGLTMQDIAADVYAASQAVTDKPVVVVGHAFGNRVARTFASEYPQHTRGVILLAAGGSTNIPSAIVKALRDSFRKDLPEAEHLAAVQLAFFAEGNDPALWRDGWYPEVAMYQEAALKATSLESWWAGGVAPMLIVQPLEDRVAPPENADQLLKAFPERVQVQMLANAGHAVLPEQPQQVAEMIINWLNEHL
ncbi:alpha/beta fold hydrolase [Halopseudomonas oceani]|uniref:alpha/beta fold hydrolase n=1 Tax=Halopseudomonas oceani TaxID=1708783 RepID=UPI001473DDED|nr:alpha/beta hydrolase [Halopseudomonas oceani]